MALATTVFAALRSCQHRHLDVDPSGPTNVVHCPDCDTTIDFGLATYVKR